MEQAIGSFNDHRMPFEWNVDSLVTSCKAKAYRYRFSNREAVAGATSECYTRSPRKAHGANC